MYEVIIDFNEKRILTQKAYLLNSVVLFFSLVNANFIPDASDVFFFVFVLVVVC